MSYILHYTVKGDQEAPIAGRLRAEYIILSTVSGRHRLANQQIVLDKLKEGWILRSSLSYEAPVWLSRGKGGYQDPYQTIPVRRSTLNALLKRKLIKYDFNSKTYIIA